MSSSKRLFSRDPKLAKIAAIVAELESRRVDLPQELVDLVAPIQAALPVKLTEDGWTYKQDGTPYVPNAKVLPFLQSNAVYAALIAGRGSGKALSIDTPIITSLGWKTMGELSIGDVVYDECGQPCEVLDTSPVMFDHDCYSVVFSDGSEIIADAEHLWCVQDKKIRKSIGRGGSVRYRVLTTEEMLNEGLQVYDREKNFSVDVAYPIEFDHKSLIIDPYVLGVWLGDGASKSSRVCFGPGKEDMPRLLEEAGIVVFPQHDPYTFRLGEYSVGRDDKGRFTADENSFYQKLVSLDLVGNKHIPEIYKFGSVEQRFSLLQGLMDTDGYADQSKCELSFTNPVLAEDAYNLLLSLGYKASFSFGDVRLNDKIFTRYRIIFTSHEPIFRLQRKLDEIVPIKSQDVRNHRRYIVDIVPVDSVPVRCITVGSPSSLFLAGFSFIPTHNSASGAQKAVKKILEGQDGAVINPSFENFKISTWPEFREWLPWDLVIPSQRQRCDPSWVPNGPFEMIFDLRWKKVRVICKGIKNAESARGPNINWLWYDEAREDRDGVAWQVAAASVRKGKNPQAWITTTPAGQQHWIYKIFVEKAIPQDAIDAMMETNSNRELVEIFYTTIFDNKDNLAPEFIASMLAMYPEGWLRRQEIYGEFVAGDGAIGATAAEALKRSASPVWEGPYYKICRFWDLAATEKKMVRGKQTNDPDETVGTLMVDDRQTIGILHQVSGCWSWEDVKKMVLDTARMDGPGVTQVFEQEPASGGKNQVAELKSHLKSNLPGYPAAESLLPRELGDRVMAANTWFAECSQGTMVAINDGTWDFDGFIRQVADFPVATHDDRVTSVSGGRHWLRPVKPRWRKIPFLKL